MEDGVACVFVAHSTCAITTIEYEPGLIKDLKDALEVIAPANKKYAHDNRWGDGNGYAHIRASLIGPSLCIPIEKGKLVLGTWQQIILIDPNNKSRTRRVTVTILKGTAGPSS